MTKIPEPKTLTGNPALVHAGFDELPHNPLHLLQNWFCDAIKLNVSEPGGLVFEELAEIHFAKESDEQSQKYARLAYEDLSKDAWMKKLYPERIQRLLELGKL